MRFTARAAVSVLVGVVVIGAAFFGGYIVGRDSTDQVVTADTTPGASTSAPTTSAPPGSTVPGQTTAPGTTPPPANTPTTRRTTYVVKSGDTLAKIAKDFDTTIAAIVELNQIKNPDKIVEGTTLQIPPPGAAVTTAPAPPPVVTTAKP